MMIFKFASVSAVIVCVAAMVQPALPQTNNLVVAVDQMPACKDPNAFVKLMAEKDPAAHKREVGTAVLSGQCTILRHDELVSVTGYSVASDLIKVRRKGFPVDFWTSPNALEQTK